jgi:hypothetical protein
MLWRRLTIETPAGAAFEQTDYGRPAASTPGARGIAVALEPRARALALAEAVGALI